jgi:hypothetical protein
MINVPETEVLERELKEKISRLDADKLRKVLAFVEAMEGKTLEKTYTASELIKLPREEREQYIKRSFELAADEDFEIFEAYSEEDFVRTIEALPQAKTYTARELLKLPLEERNRIVKALLERTLDDDVELFEANSEADFDDE